MAKPIPLDEAIVAVLTQSTTADTGAAILVEAGKTLADLIRQADTADVESLNPLCTNTQARERRGRASDLRFEADRMEASVSALESRVSELREAEQDARAEEAKAAALKERDELAADIAREYPGIVRKLTEMVKRIHESDRRLERLHLRDGSAEAIGRGVPPHFYENMTPVMRIDIARLPMPSGHKLAWEDDFVGGGMRYNGLEIDPPAGVVE